MKKIYFIREKHTPFGGAENFLSRLVAEFQKKNIQIRVIKSPFPLFLPSWLRVIFFNIFLCIRKQNKFYFSLDRIVCPDVYRAGDGVHKVFIRQLSKKSNNPLHKIYIHVERKCFNNSKLIIANSNMVKNEIIQTYGIKEEKIRVIYNGVKIPDISFVGDFNLKKKSQFDQFKKTILFVGNGFERKGLKSFIRIISKLRSENFQALIIGNDKKIEDYKRTCKDLNLDKVVKFLGNRKDMHNFYSLSDIVILPTKYDPFSNVMLEAMSYKNVVITTLQNGASEVIPSYWVMKSHEDMSIVDKIDEALDSDHFLDDVKRINLEIVQNYSIEKNAQKTLTTLEEFL